jgi:hypothetical protein
MFQKTLDVLCKPNKVIHFVIASIAVIIGFFFNSFEEMPLFLFKAPFGFFLYIILTYAIYYLKNKNAEIIIEFTGDPQLVKCQKKYTERSSSNSNYILCIVACIYFTSISIILGFVKMNLIGVYSLIGLCYIVFAAFIVFQQFIYILLLAYDVSRICPGNYYELLPERTSWLQLLEAFSRVYRNVFIIAGSLFILLFIVFSPVNSIRILFQDTFSSSLFLPLLCTWVIILFAIVIMIPFSSFIRYRLIRQIYDNLASQSIENYNKQYRSSTNTKKLIYMDIILRMYDRKYVLRKSYSWIVPAFVSLVNFSSVLISTIVDLRELGLFS